MPHALALPLGLDSEQLAAIEKTELHQHVDGSIPVRTVWELMRRHGLAPASTEAELEKLLVLQPEEEGTLLSYLDKFHYPLWVTQFFENIERVVRDIVDDAVAQGVRTLELRYSPVIHTYAGLTLRQSIVAVLSAMRERIRTHGPDRLRCGLVVIAMRQQGPHIAKILARQAISEAHHLHRVCGVVGFDIAGAERGTPPRLFRDAFEIASKGGLGRTAHAGEDEGAACIWEAVDVLGVNRIGHACSAVHDRELIRRLARDNILVECCLTSNWQTGAARREERHPLYTFLEAGVPVAICTDNVTVSGTTQLRESALVAAELGVEAVAEIHQKARRHSFLASEPGG
ncbi:MAG TPA: adenosine deaminase [Deltaproteobacteria bacterium]|jgi:adenosine deaminase|nr:adenosine deaminase [Deltaproteobacteria bacterium]